MHAQVRGVVCDVRIKVYFASFRKNAMNVVYDMYHVVSKHFTLHVQIVQCELLPTSEKYNAHSIENRVVSFLYVYGRYFFHSTFI